MRDDTRAEVQWGKVFPQLMLCSARYREAPQAGAVAPVEITFPDGEVLASDDPRMTEKLTALCDRAASLWPLQPASNRDFYKRYKPGPEVWMREIIEVFAREPGEPIPDFSRFPEVLTDYVSVPGTFFDNEELHLITTASLAYMRQKNRRGPGISVASDRIFLSKRHPVLKAWSSKRGPGRRSGSAAHSCRFRRRPRDAA